MTNFWCEILGKHNWIVATSGFPYTTGYGVMCKRCRMIVATGLSREQAEIERDELREIKK